MKRRQSRAKAGNPFLVWMELATKTSEMMMASALVIGHRTSRMSLSGSSPSARDRREFVRMQEEKIEAAGRSAQAMTAHMLAMDPLLGFKVYRQMLSGASAMASLAESRTVHQFVERQAKLIDSTNKWMGPASELSDAAAQLAGRGLKPIHAAATSNARRLASTGRSSRNRRA